ncbi:MAG: HlyD family efflux transporter periplasmic adaptor subunit, partial [Bacteroidales bacterium]|nr:HlyD family efflux transporter periplasmic adaptor subunit [Bacteroidales bacterium]
MPDSNNNQKIELRSERVQEILGLIPSWIVRWGMLLFLLLIFVIVFGSWVFKYPHIVKSRILVTTENPPSNAIARTDGRIMTLFVKDNQNVSAGQVLALIENTAIYEDVQNLKQQADSFKNLISFNNEVVTMSFRRNLILGNIQSWYASFLKNYDDLQNFVKLDYHDQKVKSMEDEIQRYKAFSWTLKKQSQILASERALSENQFSRDSTLFVQGVIPAADYEKSRSELLQKQRSYEQSRTAIMDAEIQISKLEQQILDLRLQKNNEFESLQLAMREALENLVSEISAWEHNFILRTTVSGTVSFTRIWSENQNVGTGDLVMTVIPRESGSMIGKIELQLQGAGKVRTGQEVKIKFDNFPYMEYGTVTGFVKSISLATS